MRDTGCAVVPGGTLMEETVPVDGCALLRRRDVVEDVDNDLITPVCFDQGGGKGAVDQQDVPLVSIWCNDSSADDKVVGSHCSCYGTLGVLIVAPVC